MNPTLEKIKRIKALPYLLLALAAGTLLLLLPKAKTETSVCAPYDASADYKTSLEAELCTLLSALDGVKTCTVVVTLDTGYEYLYASDQSVRETSSGKETDKKIVLANDGDGQSPLLLREKMPTVAAVAVGLRGDEQAKADARALLASLFGPDVRICVK